MSHWLKDHQSSEESHSPFNHFWVRIITGMVASLVAIGPLLRPQGEAKVSPNPAQKPGMTINQIPKLSHPWWQELQAKLRDNATTPAPSPTLAPWQRPGLLAFSNKSPTALKVTPSASAKAALELAREMQGLMDETASESAAVPAKSEISLDVKAFPAASLPRISVPRAGSPLSLEEALSLAIVHFQANSQNHQTQLPLVPLQVTLPNGQKIDFASAIPVAMQKAVGKPLQASPEMQIWQLKADLLPWINRVVAAYDDLSYHQQRSQILRRYFAEIQALVEQQTASGESRDLAFRELESAQQLVLEAETAWQLRQYELLNLLQIGQRFPVVVSGDSLTNRGNVDTLSTLQAKALQNRIDYWQLQHRFTAGKSGKTFGTKANERLELVMRRPDLNQEGNYQQSLVDFQQARNQLIGLQQEIPQQVAQDYRELQQQKAKLAIVKQQHDLLQKQSESLADRSAKLVQILHFKAQFKEIELQALQAQSRYLQAFRQLDSSTGLTLETVQIRIESH